MLDDVRLAARAAGRRAGSSRSSSRRGGAPSATASNELLELGPAIGLGEDALAERVGEGVDRDPVVRPARAAAAEQLPGALRVGANGPLEQAEREPARLDVGSRGAGRRDVRGSVDGRSRRVAALNPRWTAASSGQRTPCVGPMPARRRPALAGTSGRRAGGARRRRARANAAGSSTCVRRAPRRAPRRASGARRRTRSRAR